MLEAKPAALDITLRPHRSLGSFGLKVVLGAVLVSNLMVVLCSERDTQPVVNAGTPPQ